MSGLPQDTYRKLRDGALCLSPACDGMEDRFWANQLKLAGNLLIDAINDAIEAVNARKVRDIEFAHQDLTQLVAELTADDAERFSRCLDLLSSGLSELKTSVFLSPALVQEMKDLARKAVERRTAAERAAFLPPDVPHDPLPHDPASLQPRARSLRDGLQTAGFETPVLDKLADTPEEFEVRDCGALADELDAIHGE
ncbi:MAG TPA: hypothetical protein VM534_03550 [Thermoanaerobaculia bacterium]|nr:hypothetical protein [Thermoanaerobaculia bacterium]